MSRSSRENLDMPMRKQQAKKKKMKKRLLSVILIALVCLSTVLANGMVEDKPVKRIEAASILDNLFALSDIHPSSIAGLESTPRNLGYTATNAAVTSVNVIPAAKDCVEMEELPRIEAVLNAGIMELDKDGLNFMPEKAVTKREFATYIAKGLYGPDLDIDHVQAALNDGVFDSSLLSDELISQGTAYALADQVKSQLQVVSVFVTSDIHGNYLPYKSSDSKFEIGSVARIKSILDYQRYLLGEENVIYVDGGDSPYNTTLSNITNGDASVAALNALGLDATVLGNHDFDYSFPNLLRLSSNADYAMLSANTRYKEGHQPDGSGLYPEEFGDYIIKKASGLKIGIFKITDDQSAATTLYSNTVDITWDDDLGKAHEIVSMLKEKEDCDVVIALSHLHSKNKALVLQEPDINISVGGGNDIAGKPTILGDNQYLINPGKHGEALTQVSLNVFKGKLVGVVYNQLFLTDAYQEDEEVKALVDSYNAQVDKALDVTIGYNSQNLEWSSALVRCQNSPIANLVTDALLSYFKIDGAQLCIVNGGEIRAKLDAGEVSIREVTSVLPFDNNMMLVETSGRTIWNALGNGISAYPSANGKFPQVAGMTYAFKAGTPNELLSVTLDDGTALDMDKTYKVVINSFIAGGGDGYLMFNVLDSTKEMATDVNQLVYVRKTYMRDALQNYFEKHTSADKPLVMDLSENRITIL